METMYPFDPYLLSKVQDLKVNLFIATSENDYCNIIIDILNTF